MTRQKVIEVTSDNPTERSFIKLTVSVDLLSMFCRVSLH
jgi:hypothetical protein